VVAGWLPRPAAVSAVRVRYPDGRGILREVLREATQRGFTIEDISAQTVGQVVLPGTVPGAPMVEVTLHVHGRQPVSLLAAALSERAGVDAVLARDAGALSE